MDFKERYFGLFSLKNFENYFKYLLKNNNKNNNNNDDSNKFIWQ